MISPPTGYAWWKIAKYARGAHLFPAELEVRGHVLYNRATDTPVKPGVAACGFYRSAWVVLFVEHHDMEPCLGCVKAALDAGARVNTIEYRDILVKLRRPG
jgi:hypothetical protein